MSDDRLSVLPDDVIIHILSFIPSTNRSARTSVLAKRWRFLWAKVPFLEFECLERFRSGNSKMISRNSKMISRALMLGENFNIHTFRLFYADYDSNDAEFESWIAAVIARNVRNLVIDLQWQLMLPRCLFTCKTLVDLTLRGCGDIMSSSCGGDDDVQLPALKRLQLSIVRFESDKSLSHLLSGCPALEELSIVVAGPAHWCISLPMLTRLDLKLNDNRSDLYYLPDEKSFEVKLDTPSLRYLKLSVHTSENILAGSTELGSLIEADIAIFRKRMYQGNFPYEHSLVDCLGMLHNIKRLELTLVDTMEVPNSWFSDQTIKFHNLTQLKVHRVDWRFVMCLLENANNLRLLTVSTITAADKAEPWIEPKQVPACLISSLETINILGIFWFLRYEFHVAKYMLENAKVLKTMEIDLQIYDLNNKKNLEALHRLYLLQRGYPACQLVLANAGSLIKLMQDP